MPLLFGLSLTARTTTAGDLRKIYLTMQQQVIKKHLKIYLTMQTKIWINGYSQDEVCTLAAKIHWSSYLRRLWHSQMWQGIS